MREGAVVRRWVTYYEEGVWVYYLVGFDIWCTSLCDADFGNRKVDTFGGNYSNRYFYNNILSGK